MTALKPIILGWDSSPAPHGTVLGAAELRDERAVARLFARAAAFRAQVTARGWRFLLDRYGLVGLIDINRDIGWFDPDDDTAAAAEIVHAAQVAGYDPARGELSTYADRLSDDER